MRRASGRPWRTAALLIVAVALAYANACIGPYQFDDFDAFVDVAATHTGSAWWRDLGHGLRPLLKLSYLVDWQLGAGAPGFHLTNVAIHAANTLLVWRLSLHGLRRWLPDADDTHASAALLAALLFALHPAQTEAVAYISGRSVSLMTLLLLLALAAYRRQRWWLAAGAYAAAVAVKEPAAILPLLLCVVEAWGPAAVSTPTARRWRLAAFLVVPVLPGLWLLTQTRYQDFILASLDTRSTSSNLLSQLDAWRYLVELGVGWRTPNIDPALVEATQWTPALLATALALLAVLLVVWRLRRTRPWLIFGAAWFVVALLPTNSVLPRYDLVNDRQWYLASIGVVVAIAAEVAQRRLLVRTKRVYALAVCVALGLAMFAGTVRRNADYRSEIALWRATVAASPGKARPHNNLGYAYQLAGCDAQAREAYEQALKLDPDYQRASDNLLVLQARAPRDAVCR